MNLVLRSAVGIGALTMGLLSSLLISAPVSALSASQYVQCGLWAGANLNFSLNRQCLQQANTSTISTSTSASAQSSRSTAAAATTQDYVALGDSVAAGLGLLGSTSDVPCGRSTQAYPNIVAQGLGLRLTSVACSGATVGDLVTQQHVTGSNQLAQLTTAFASGTPKLITITAGANDAHWASFIRACYVTNCATSTTTTVANLYLAALQAKLHYALASIQYRSAGSPPQVILTGYYNPLSANCAALETQITPTELSWVQHETDKLNQTLQTTASHYPFVTFVPVDFAGHDICSSDTWVQSISDPAPFHPNATGQQAIANQILTTIHP